jgi:hypothetical protein
MIPYLLGHCALSEVRLIYMVFEELALFLSSSFVFLKLVFNGIIVSTFVK